MFKLIKIQFLILILFAISCKPVFGMEQAKLSSIKNDGEKGLTAEAATFTSATTLLTSSSKATKKQDVHEPKYILDLSAVEKEKALKRGKIDDDVMNEAMHNAVKTYLDSVKTKNRQVLEDENIILNAHIACQTLKFSAGQKDYTQEIEAAYIGHMKLFPHKWATRQKLQTYFTHKCSRPCYADTQLSNVPLVHTYSELRSLAPSIQPLAAFKMLQFAFSKYEDTIGKKEAFSIIKLNKLANSLVTFYYAQRIFLDINNHRKKPYMVSHCSPKNFGTQIMEHYAIDRKFRKQETSVRDFTFQPYYLAYEKLTNEQEKLQKQLEEKEQQLKVEKEKQQKAAANAAKKKKDDDKAQELAKQQQQEAEVARQAKGKADAAERKKKKTEDRNKARLEKKIAATAATTVTSIKTATHEEPVVQNPVTQASAAKQLDKTSTMQTVENITLVTKAEHEAKEKLRKKAEKKRLRLMKYEIKKLIQEGYNFGAEEAWKTVAFEKVKQLNLCQHGHTKNTCYSHIINPKNAQELCKYDLQESAIRIFEAAKGPIRLAILAGFDPDQFIKKVNENKDIFAEWELYQTTYKLLSPIPEYTSLVGRSPDDMIRNMFRLAHTIPDDRLIS